MATWYVGVLDGREVTKPGVRFTDAAGSVFVVPESAVVPARPRRRRVQTGRAPVAVRGDDGRPARRGRGVPSVAQRRAVFRRWGLLRGDVRG